MAEYLGETKVELKDTEYSHYKKIDWIQHWIEMYGQYDGGHHKQWVMDQCIRIRYGAKIKIRKAKWSDGTEEYRISLGRPTKKYIAWVAEMEAGEDGPKTYTYDEGIAP